MISSSAWAPPNSDVRSDFQSTPTPPVASVVSTSSAPSASANGMPSAPAISGATQPRARARRAFSSLAYGKGAARLAMDQAELPRMTTRTDTVAEPVSL